MTAGWALLVVTLALVWGAVGGFGAAAAVIWLRTRWPRLLVPQDYQLNVRLVASPVTLPVQVEEPEPVVVPITTAPAPSVRELMLRVVNVMPTIGPTDLAAIAGCSKSTAHEFIRRWQAGEFDDGFGPEHE